MKILESVIRKQCSLERLHNYRVGVIGEACSQDRGWFWTHIGFPATEEAAELDLIAVVADVLAHACVCGVPRSLLPVGYHRLGVSSLVDPRRYLTLLTDPDPVVASATMLLLAHHVLFPSVYKICSTYSPLMSAA